MDKIGKLQEIIEQLNQAAKAYYVQGQEIMSNLDYDRLYDRLEELEEETGIVMANSPTQRVGYQVMSSLPKEVHEEKMLSLDKTKSVSSVESFLGSQPGVLSWKLDGLTLVLTYEKGQLIKAVTRGNGEVGEVVTNNARVFENIPLTIPYREKLVVRGEALISYSRFQAINEELPQLEAAYKNPRNLCSGSVRQLNNEMTAQRGVRFIAFSLVQGPGDYRSEQFQWLQTQGFEVVSYEKVSQSQVAQVIQDFGARIAQNDYPADGLVICYDDIQYGKALGQTAKFPRDSLAFKWQDERQRTILEKMIWSPSRTGLINPVALFSPVQLEGTSVTRASVHNVSIFKELALAVGDEISVYKANMIIPQIAENHTRSGPEPLPEKCPACDQPLQVQDTQGVEVLMCLNPQCPVKALKSLLLLVSRNGLDIRGLSQSTLEKFLEWGIIREPADLFFLQSHQQRIEEMEGFGPKSYENLIKAVEKARKTTPARVLYGLGIPGIGAANGQRVSAHCDHQWERISHLTREELEEIEGIGAVMAQAYVDYFAQKDQRKRVDRLVEQLEWETLEAEQEPILKGITVVITGTLNRFSQRKECQHWIESRGGKVSSSVSSKTTYLINNDKTSSSAKNQRARKEGIPILSEEEFLEKFKEKSHVERG